MYIKSWKYYYFSANTKLKVDENWWTYQLDGVILILSLLMISLLVRSRFCFTFVQAIHKAQKFCWRADWCFSVGNVGGISRWFWWDSTNSYDHVLLATIHRNIILFQQTIFGNILAPKASPSIGLIWIFHSCQTFSLFGYSVLLVCWFFFVFFWNMYVSKLSDALFVSFVCLVHFIYWYFIIVSLSVYWLFFAFQKTLCTIACKLEIRVVVTFKQGTWYCHFCPNGLSIPFYSSQTLGSWGEAE